VFPQWAKSNCEKKMCHVLERIVDTGHRGRFGVAVNNSTMSVVFVVAAAFLQRHDKHDRCDQAGDGRARHQPVLGIREHLLAPAPLGLLFEHVAHVL
jgi:hypothetical protein